MDRQESAVASIVGLGVGQSVCRTRVIQANAVSLNALHRTRRDLMIGVNEAVLRAKLQCPQAVYRVDTLHTFTQQLDLVVISVVRRKE